MHCLEAKCGASHPTAAAEVAACAHLCDGVVVLLPLEHDVARNLPGRGVNLRLQHVCEGGKKEKEASGSGQIVLRWPRMLGGMKPAGWGAAQAGCLRPES